MLESPLGHPAQSLEPVFLGEKGVHSPRIPCSGTGTELGAAEGSKAMLASCPLASQTLLGPCRARSGSAPSATPDLGRRNLLKGADSIGAAINKGEIRKKNPKKPRDVDFPAARWLFAAHNHTLNMIL